MPFMYNFSGNPDFQFSQELVGFPERLAVDDEPTGQNFLVCNWDPAGAGEIDPTPIGQTWLIRPSGNPSTWSRNVGFVFDNGFDNEPVVHHFSFFADNCYFGRVNQINGQLFELVERGVIAASTFRGQSSIVVFPGERLGVVFGGSQDLNFSWCTWSFQGFVRDTTGYTPDTTEDEPFTPLPPPIEEEGDIQSMIDKYVRAAFSASGVNLPEGYDDALIGLGDDDSELVVDEAYPDPFDLDPPEAGTFGDEPSPEPEVTDEEVTEDTETVNDPPPEEEK